ncbi:MAG: UDP-N-acetylglucosamine--N-acetylmuramyl-(pentapeptide) pyrophosphoryl-undecaprenol N-acetylglucosamine transferase [Bulleidia sp.]
MKKVMIACGGTGGHIYPALALADEIRRQDATCTVVFTGSRTRMEATIIPENGYRFIPLDVQSTGGGLLAKAAGFFSVMRMKKKCLSLLRQERPDVCVGFGNYISVPLILAAHQLHIPTMISEQNSAMGKANRFLARFADAIEAAYPASVKGLPEKKVRVLGNPQGSSVRRSKTSEYRHEKPFVLCMMGSLGSATVSKAMDDALPYLHRDFDVLIVSGKANPHHFQHTREGVRVIDYADGAAVLQACDLAVLRAGATTLSEAASLHVPSILIPSPYVPGNHQVHNAAAFVEAGAAMMMEEKDLDGARLARAINALMQDPEKRLQMGTQAGKLARPEAAKQMVQWLRELAG